tara:strand:- start:918 stop:1571 length:654 start_codon:yes stop_codon:yes gene_type:complete
MKPNLKIEKKLPSYLKRTSKGGLLIGFIYVAAFMSILFLAIWQTFESESNNASMTLVDERLSLIEEQINVVDETNNDSMTDITSSIQFLDKEIRKLWDLSNKRNKVNIQNLTKQMQVVENLISDFQSNLDKNEKDINQIKKNINLNLAKLNSLELTEENIESIQLSIKNVDMQLILLEDSVQALNSYKNQLNQVILEIQTDISIIQSSSIQNLPNQN